MTDYLVDLASYQHGVDLAVVKRAGFTKVNIKLTQGTGYVSPYIREFVDGARANGMDLGTFHWLDGRSTGAAQAQAALAQMDKFGLRYGTAHQCDCEDGTYPATWQIWLDYMNAMQDGLARPAINYTGDWWWPKHMAGHNGAAVTPYLWAAPNHGYDPAYPGDTSGDWAAGYGGWEDYSALQYAVGPIAGAGGGNLSKTAFRDPSVWSKLTGVSAAASGGDMKVYAFGLSDGPVPAGKYYGTLAGGYWWMPNTTMDTAFLANMAKNGVVIDTGLGVISSASAFTVFGPYIPNAPVAGPPGKDGAPGKDGKDGVDGQDGAPGVVQLGTELTVTVTGTPVA